MIPEKFKALVSREDEKGNFSFDFEEVSFDFLKSNDVIVKVHYSSLNYKDALVARGHKGISRNYPTIPGVDAAGEIVKSNDENFKIGDKVIVTGHDLGMNTPGGFAEYISVPSSWLIPLPPELSFKHAMVYGTAGVTAALCINELINSGVTPDKGKIIVTGATGGVGCMAVGILEKLGFEVIASTGKINETSWLKNIGAKEVIDRKELEIESDRPLLSARWIGAIDNVGGRTLENLLKTTGQHGAVCSVGLVASDNFFTTVYPFILRGIKLIGIDSAERGLDQKLSIWMKLSQNWMPNYFENLFREVNFLDLKEEINLILKGGQKGKVVVKILND